MLPPFNRFSELFSRFCDRELRERTESRLGPFYRDIRKRRQFEGSSSTILRPDEPPEENDYHSSEDAFSIRLDEIPTMTVDDLRSRIDGVAEAMARSIGTGMFASLDKTMEKHGRVANLGPPSPENILEMIRRIDVSFDRGQPNFQIVVPSSLHGLSEAAYAKLIDDPDLNRKFVDLMSDKWEEWRASEADRGLDG